MLTEKNRRDVHRNHQWRKRSADIGRAKMELLDEELQAEKRRKIKYSHKRLSKEEFRNRIMEDMYGI